jgi:hypothetical protein
VTCRDRTAERVASLPRCVHGALLRPPPSLAHLECRDCLPDGSSVDAWIERHSDGAECADVAEALGITRQGVAACEARAVAKVLAVLALLAARRRVRAGGTVADAGANRRRVSGARVGA